MAYNKVQVLVWFMSKIKILGICGEYNAVGWYRMMNPVGEYGGDLSFKVGVDKDNEGSEKVLHIGELKKNIAELGDSFFSAYDVVLVKYIARKEDAQSILYWKSKSPNTKVFLDVDDNVFEIPEGNSAKSKWGEQEQSILAFFANECDGITCSTLPLAEYFRELNPNVYVIPNKIKASVWKPLKRDKIIKIGWTYSSTHAPDKEVLGNALKTIKDKYPDVIIETTGSQLEGTENVVGCPFAFYHKWLCERNWDIAIAPLQDNQFNAGKSNIKWLESTMSGAVFVGSNVFPYSESIEHGKTGFLAETEQDWVDILSMLIESKEIRKTVHANAKKVVLKNYNIEVDNPIKALEKEVQGQ